MAIDRDRESSSSEDVELQAAIDGFVAGESGAREFELPEPIGSIGSGNVLDDFELLRELGGGSMGVVYEARQSSVPGRIVAVKVLRCRAASTLERFRREIAIIGRLDHPTIVPIIAANLDHRCPYFAMKFVAGVPLGRLVEILRRSGSVPEDCRPVAAAIDSHLRDSPAPAALGSARERADQPYSRWVAEMLVDLAEALAHAHDHGVIHRDVKPWNILLTADARPVLIDFGLARDEGLGSLTVDAAFVGTAAYSSPEQIRGESLDARTDVYSLAATGYELLTLRRPFEAASRVALERAIQESGPTDLGADVPRDLRVILNCALERSRKHRYASCADLAEDLRRHLEGVAIAARPPGLVRRGTRALRRHARWLAAAMVISVGALAIGRTVEARSRAALHVQRAELLASTAERLSGRLADLRQALPALRSAAYRHGEVLASRREMARLDGELRAACVRARSLLQLALTERAGWQRARRSIARVIAVELRHALACNEDCIAPDRVLGLDRQLEAFDGAELYPELAVRESLVELRTHPAGAVVSIRSLRGESSAARVAVGARSPFARALAEGSYVATIRHPGYEPVRLPFVVRRPAALAASGLPGGFHRLDVELLEDELLTDGWCHVPGGWSLLGESPAEWRRVRSFAIRRRETSCGEWLDYLRGRVARDAQLTSHAERARSRDLWLPGLQPLIERDARGAPRLAEGVSAGRPATRMPSYAIDDYVWSASQRMGRPDRAWVDLPSVDEWERAARGADGRRFPWGNEFRADANDVSPFGVYGMSSGVAEWTRSKYGAQRELFVVCGASDAYREDPKRREASHRREVFHGGQTGLGVRLAMLLDSGAEFEAATLPYVDDFERSELGPRWRGSIGTAWYSRPAHEGETVELRDGKLFVRGGTGNGSNRAQAFTALDLPAHDYRVSARVLVTSAAAGYPAAQLHLASSLTPAPRARATLQLHDSGAQLQVSGVGQPGSSVDVPGYREGVESHVEVTVRERRLETRVWPVGQARPVDAAVLVLAEELSPLRYLLFAAGQLTGMALEVDDVRVARLR